MDEYLDLLIKNNFCKEAIEEFDKIDTLDWKIKYAELYDSVTFAPEGLPRITRSHFKGERFESVIQFAILFDRTNWI